MADKKEKFKKFAESLKGTFLEELVEIDESEYEDSDVALDSDDIVLGRMSDIEKRINTLMSWRFYGFCDLCSKFLLDEEDIEDLWDYIQEGNIKGIDELLVDISEKFSDLKIKDFPIGDWLEIFEFEADYRILFDILGKLIQDRLPEAREFSYLFKNGFSIVKSHDVNDGDYLKYLDGPANISLH